MPRGRGFFIALLQQFNKKGTREMKRKQKVLTICRCGRQLEGKFWIVPIMSLRKWVTILARRASNRDLSVKIEKCPFCTGRLEEAHRPIITGAW